MLLGRAFDTYFETRPLEDILLDIADGWNSTKQLATETQTMQLSYTGAYEL